MADDPIDGSRPTLRSQRWFDNPNDPEMTALYMERQLNWGLSWEELQSGRLIIGIALWAGTATVRGAVRPARPTQGHDFAPYRRVRADVPRERRSDECGTHRTSRFVNSRSSVQIRVSAPFPRRELGRSRIPNA